MSSTSCGPNLQMMQAPRGSDVKLTALVARNARMKCLVQQTSLPAGSLIGNDPDLRIAYGNNP